MSRKACFFFQKEEKLITFFFNNSGLVELFDILFLKYINAAGTPWNPQAHLLMTFPSSMYTHVQALFLKRPAVRLAGLQTRSPMLAQLKGIARRGAGESRMGERAGGTSWGLCGAHPALPVFGLLPLLPRLLGGHVCLSVCMSGGGGLHSSVVCGACGSLTCFSAE